MSVFYVFQGETYSIEKKGGYVWSPQLAKGGRKNIGYTTMTEIHKGDFILHNDSGKIVAVSIATSDCYASNQPHELQIANTSVTWDISGYRVDCNYFSFDTPVKTNLYTDWLKAHYAENSAFTNIGRGKQQYMCHLADEHAVFFLNEAIRLQSNPSVIASLHAALSDIIDDKESEYSAYETEAINEAVQLSNSHQKPTWKGIPEIQPTTTSPSTGREIPKRDPQRAVDALEHADFLCEFDKKDKTFLRKNGTPYTEPHHLIPMSKYRLFDHRVDVMENIVSLCSHCHNLLHYGQFKDKKPILDKLYQERKEALNKCGLALSLEQLYSFYK